MKNDPEHCIHPNPTFRLVSPEEKIDIELIESFLWFHANKRRIADVGDVHLYGVRSNDPCFNLTELPHSIKLPWLAFTVHDGTLQKGGLSLVTQEDFFQISVNIDPRPLLPHNYSLCCQMSINECF